jgi:hypothetical protein
MRRPIISRFPLPDHRRHRRQRQRAEISRELNWQPAGLNGGLDEFEMSGNTSPDTKYAFSGHFLRMTTNWNLSLDRSDLGFIHAGWDQYRKYYSDTGGFSLPSARPPPMTTAVIFFSTWQGLD